MAVQRCYWLYPCLGLTGLLLSVGDLSGQHFRSGFQVGVGWVANVPTSYLGFSVMPVTPSLFGGAGLYADVKLTNDSPKNDVGFLSGVTVEDAELTFGDRLFSDHSDWVTVDLALVYAVAPELVLYGGAGYSKETHYREYFDEAEERGNFGFYWVADPADTGTRVNILGGAIMRLNRYVSFQVGGQTKPVGVNVGVVLTLIR